MSPQTRKTVLKRIRIYLQNNPEELKGVRGFQSNRLEGLIKRLDTFSPIETLRWNVPDRKLFRDVAVAAGIQFVREYPMLYHTPNSLRACFGMPTRTDRKKGRFSSIFYRNEAVERQFRPRIEDLEKLQSKIFEMDSNDFQEEISILKQYSKRALLRRYNDDIIDTPESDHSETSITRLKTYLNELGFENLQESSEIPEEYLQNLDGVVLAPDMIGTWKNQQWWIELKEYRDLKFNSKVIFQVFRYLYQNPFVLLVSISSLTSFSQLLAQHVWNAKTLRKWGIEKQDDLLNYAEGWNKKRSSYSDLGRMLKLDPRHEALFLALTNEIVTREIGLTGTELKGIEKFLNLVESFRAEIKIYNFDDFINNDVLPSEYCLLLKMNFPFHSNNNSGNIS
ncbi:MAG: hypothetical protein ACXAC8_08750 [Candidatus Hodarchaeales archaeon]